MRWLLIAAAFAGVTLCDSGHPLLGIFLGSGAFIFALLHWEKQNSEP